MGCRYFFKGASAGDCNDPGEGGQDGGELGGGHGEGATKTGILGMGNREGLKGCQGQGAWRAVGRGRLRGGNGEGGNGKGETEKRAKGGREEGARREISQMDMMKCLGEQ